MVFYIVLISLVMESRHLPMRDGKRLPLLKWDGGQPLFYHLCKVEEHCASESPIKETCWKCGGFGCLVRACIVARFSFFKVPFLSLLQLPAQQYAPLALLLQTLRMTYHSSFEPLWLERLDILAEDLDVAREPIWLVEFSGLIWEFNLRSSSVF